MALCFTKNVVHFRHDSALALVACVLGFAAKTADTFTS
jgi:uncharacterized membrane protein